MQKTDKLPTDWDEIVASQNGHFLQSSAWASFQQLLGHKIVCDHDTAWSYLASLRQIAHWRYLFVQAGPTIVKSHQFKHSLTSLRQQAQVLGCTFVRIEPIGAVDESELAALGASEVAPIEPKYPWVLDISADESKLRTDLSAGHRYGINSAERKGLRFEKSQKSADIEIFLQMMHDTAKDRFGAHSDEYYRKMYKTLHAHGAAQLFFAYHDREPVASALVFDWQGTRYYAHAGAFQAINRRLSGAMPLVWHMIIDAKANGYHAFDFWGVTPSDDPKHPWAGFSKFKKAFGGQMLSRLGTWELPIRQNQYRLYKIAKRIRNVA